MKKLTYSEIENVCESLSMLLHSGISASDGLFIISEEADKKELLLSMKDMLDGGKSLSDAMESSGVFPVYVCRMTKVGEESGHLEDVLHSMAQYYRERRLITRQVRDTLTYPVILCVVMLLVVALLVVRVLPIFDEVYRSLGSSLDGAAGALLHLAEDYPIAMIAIGAVIALIFILALLVLTFPSLSAAFIAFYAKVRGDRGAVKQFADAHFVRVLELGLSSGMTADRTLKMGEELFEKGSAAQKRCEKCREKAENGADLSKALEESGILSPLDSRLLSVGMKNGNGDAVMKKIALSLMEKAEYNLKKRISLIEPAIVLTMSLIIGFVLLSVMLPLADIMSMMG